MSERLGYTFYPKDFISDPEVMMMSPSERGVYRDLIDLAYMSENKIKYTIEKIAKYCNATIEEVNAILDLKGEKIGEYWTIPSCNKRIKKAQINRVNGGKGGRPPKTQTKTETITQTKTDIETQNERQREREREKEKQPPTPKGEVIDFNFDVYLQKINELFGKNLRVVNDKVKRSIKARLKEGYTKENIWNAMLNVANDDWHKEKGYVHCTPQYFAQVKVLDMHGSRYIPKDNKQVGAKTEYYLHD